MKILITTDLFTTATNGVVTSVKNLYDELQKKGHDVRILTLSETHHSRKEGTVTYIRSMPIKVYPDVRMSFAKRHPLIKELIEWKPDVIHTQCEFFTFRFASYISSKTKAPLIHTYHTMYEQYVSYIVPGKRLGHFIVRTLSRNILKHVKRIIVPTPKVEDTLLGYDMHQTICVVPSGISLEQHKKRLSDGERAKKRRALGIADDQVVLLNLGRLGTEKNLEELVAFYAKASKLHEDLRFMIVGDGPAKASLEKLAATLGVSDRVIFTGMVKPSEVQKYYQLGDIFVSASTSETQGLTYVEAAANGLPLLCREDLCLKGVVIQGENGYAYTNEAEFLESLKVIMEDPAWLSSARRRSQELAATFDKSAFGDAVEKVYQDTLQA